MATIVEGDASLFNSLAYGGLHPQTQEYLQTQLEAPSPLLTQAGNTFFQNANALYDRLAGSTAIRMAKAARRAIGGIWQTDEIKTLSTIEEMQWAPLKMQRWIMASPFVRNLYHKQQIEGYSGSYIDPFPNEVGEEHYDYRRVMNGVVVDTEDDGWSATTYLDDLLPDDEELTLEEQIDIMQTWELVKASIKKGGDDPTSRWNAEL